MKFFAERHFFPTPEDLDDRWLNGDEEKAEQVKQIMVIPGLSLYDLMQLRPEVAKKLVTHLNCYNFSQRRFLWYDNLRYRTRSCLVRVCETMSRGFFKKWALDPFMELIHYRLPILCCDMILDQLTNEELYHICLAVAPGQTQHNEACAPYRFEREQGMLLLGLGQQPELLEITIARNITVYRKDRGARRKMNGNLCTHRGGSRTMTCACTSRSSAYIGCDLFYEKLPKVYLNLTTKKKNYWTKIFTVPILFLKLFAVRFTYHEMAVFWLQSSPEEREFVKKHIQRSNLISGIIGDYTFDHVLHHCFNVNRHIKRRTTTTTTTTTTSLIRRHWKRIFANNRARATATAATTQQQQQQQQHPAASSAAAAAAAAAHTSFKMRLIFVTRRVQGVVRANRQREIYRCRRGRRTAKSKPRARAALVVEDDRTRNSKKYLYEARRSSRPPIASMENSGESGEDSGSLGTAAFLAGNNISSGYIIHSDDMEDDPENTDDSNHASDHLHGGHSGGGGTLREQDRFLPIANVAKIMKRAIPDAGKIAKDARECVQECVSEFISFITSEASDRCHMEKRKTINGEDILFAMTTLGFDNYVEPLKLYLQNHKTDKEIILALYDYRESFVY
ncbi:unnamed protein product [Trichogramma brassicae]|uniref:Nuclear transcription factor Y subunit beta n=1 Tax=Trichogramma brassicae TaxID=86971 RepID=A0A6H5IKN0_9HYME|nr:unnamed protein product [Trichogramma brassicae]